MTPDLSGYQRLARAVLVRAVEDARDGRVTHLRRQRAARSWLAHDSRLLLHWAALAGWSVPFLRRAAGL